jgi:hypothetical protein
VSNHIESRFPNLANGVYTITSPQTGQYNCVAWAARNDRRWWWPSESPYAYWPENVLLEETLESFVQVFLNQGYEPCNNDDLEAGYEKVAIYVDSSGTPTHMARQLESGRWTSKLGKLEDIEHETLEQLEGPSSYGVAFQILKRPRLK